MSENDNELLKEFTPAEKSIERKMQEARENLEKCFSGEGRLRITSSDEGNQRVRAFIPDEDGYAGWVEHASYIGIAKQNTAGKVRYLAERYFPSRKDGKLTMLWEYIPETDELLTCRQKGATDEQQIGMPILANETEVGYFLRLTRDMATADSFNDYERDYYTASKYVFQLEDLK